MYPVKSEEKKLMEAYKKISSKYTKLKTKPWKDFQSYLSFLESRFPIPSSGILLDLGSGNGRNLILFKDKPLHMIASDLSFPLLNALVPLPSQKVHTINNDMRFLPLKQGSSDLILLIAAIHHLRKKEDMIKVLNDVSLILKNDGYLILSCWRRWKKDTRKKMIRDLLMFSIRKLIDIKWKHGDILLPWYNEKQEVIARRYYHLFTKRELKKILMKSDLIVLNFSCLGGPNQKDNFFVLLKKSKK